ncbi:MAG: SMP-30/gluconolactonase/LRE family protein [Myxococcota bacterium]|nr:SMP-30/gluconolactonase/LRE family protein [Myxococcota bacterium]
MTEDAGGGRVDSGTAPVDGGGTDGGSDPSDGGALDAFVPPSDGGTTACGDARPAVAGIRGTEGLIIARDGTIYYSQNGGVGRLPVGGAAEDRWVRIPGTGTIWGLALDAANENLYVGSPEDGTVYVIDTTAASPAATAFVTGAGAPNGLTVGPDDALYFSDFGAGRVNRVALGGSTGTATPVTTTPVPNANGVAFLPDGTLLVASYSSATVFRLTLTAGVETGRATFATGVGSPDGIAVDAEGRVYVTDNAAGRLIRLEADGASPMTLLMGVGAAASLDFGAGALDCEDIYVASSGAMRRYEDGTTPGAPVIWH